MRGAGARHPVQGKWFVPVEWISLILSAGDRRRFGVGGTQGLVCNLILCPKVFSIILRPLYIFFSFARVLSARGLNEFCTCHVFRNAATGVF